MSDETYTFDSARVRLEQIATEVRKKDTSLEKSLDLLEEGVRLANQCTELIDAKQWRSTLEAAAVEGDQAREGEAGETVATNATSETDEADETKEANETSATNETDVVVVEEVVIQEFAVHGVEADEPVGDDERS